TTETERKLAGIWSELLGIDRIGTTDDFFDLGGHSLLATRVIGRIRTTLGIDLPLAALFDQPTIRTLAALIDADNNPTATPITPTGRDRQLPLSFAQQRLWFLTQLDPDSTEYHVPVMIPLDEGTDPAAVADALTAIVERHEVLRTRIVTDADDRPYQVIDAPAPVPLDVIDTTGGDSRGIGHALITAPFDLAIGPLLRAGLLREHGNRYTLVLCMHHIVADEWSAAILRDELQAFLGQAGPRPPDLPVQYADYAVWQRQHLVGEVLDGQLAYWRRQLADPPVLELPADRPRPPIRSADGAAVTVRIPEHVTDGLRELSRARGTTMFMTLAAAYAVLLHRHTGQNDLLIGTPVANRGQAETENLIGFFVNTLALRTRFDTDPTFEELLDLVRRTALDAYDHQDLPFEQLVDELVHDRDRSRTPLIQTLFNHTTTSHDTIHGTATQPTAVKWDLSLTTAETPTTIHAALQYSTALFDDATIRAWADHLLLLLDAIVTDPGRPVSLLPVLTAGEESRLAALNDTSAEVSHTGIVDLFSRQDADRVAIVDGDRRIRYRELGEYSDSLAHGLLTQGVRPGDLVALILPRGAELITAMLAALKAGAVYLPIDVTTPPARIAQLLDDAAPVVVLTGPGSERPQTAATVLDIAAFTTGDPAASRPDLNGRAAGSSSPAGRVPLPVRSPDDPAYLIYTSGSTGTPKGVLIPHHNLTNLITTTAREYGFGPDDTWTLFHSPAFDFAVWEIWAPLLTGGRL
ncbi:condensation domain-containing protein, partial [Actinoplanes italicus]|uniref:condensation domain-containing protein n=1 Tax=Actinoplanes italicus TaxID=113567 RepID=UPI0011B25008